MREYCIEYGGSQVVVDRRGQMLEAEIEDLAGPDEHPPPDAVGWNTVSTGIRMFSEEATWVAPIHATVIAAGIGGSFTPAVALAVKSKGFQERLLSTLSVLIHEGAGPMMGRRRFLAELGDALEDLTVVDGAGGALDKAEAYHAAARGLLDAARHVLGEELPDDGPRKGFARKWLSRLLRDPRHTRPFGMYAESAAAKAIYQADRLLQTPLVDREVETFRNAIESSPELVRVYGWHHAVAWRLAGRPATKSAVDPVTDDRRPSLFPPVEPLETALLAKVLGDATIPPGFDLGGALVAAFDRGELEALPRPDDGWPLHLLYANASLLEPSREGVRPGREYLAELEGRFMARYGRPREPHLKRSTAPTAVEAPFVIEPRITVEPLPEYYRRFADAYASLRDFLVDRFGVALDRVAAGGGGALSLAEELSEMELIFRGAWAVSREELGRPADLDRRAREDARVVFRRWQARHWDDADLAQDLRAVEPLWWDPEREVFRARVVLGVETRRLRVDFAHEPKVAVYASGDDSPFPQSPTFLPAVRMVLSPITLVCDLARLPTREQLRAICAESDRPAEVQAMLVDRFGR